MRSDVAIFSAVYKGRPTPQAEDAAAVNGGYIACWVRAESKVEAAERARRTIEARLWVIETMDVPWNQVTESSLGPESLGHFEQAKVDGECYVFHTWSKDAQDGAAGHRYAI